MNNNRLLIFAITLFFTVACQPSGQEGNGPETEAPAPAPVLSFEQQDFRRQSPSCVQDSNYCARVEAVYPLAIAGPEQVVQRINDTIDAYLKISLAVFAPTPEDIPGSLDSIATSFLEEYETFMAEEGGFRQEWSVELDGQVLYQSDKVVAVELSTFSYAGGAHPNSFVYLVNFDARDGEVLRLPELVQDTARLRELAEMAFREARGLGPEESLADAGFFWGGEFALPENYALTEEGLYFFYNPYEVAAYVVGPTSFTISRKQLSGMLPEGY